MLLKNRSFLPVVLACCCTAVLTGYYHLRELLAQPPSLIGDEPEYDAIGLALSKGKGFVKDFTDPEFWTPYYTSRLFDPVDNRDSFPTTPRPDLHRPPGLPVLYAGVNAVFGRSMLALRLVNLLLSGIVMLLILKLIGPQFGQHSVTLVAFGLLFNETYRLYSYAMLTETMSALLIALLMIVITQSKQNAWKSSVLTGLLWASLIMFRTSFIVWFPVFLLGTVFIHRTEDRWEFALPDASRAGHSGVVLLIAMLCMTPWAVRNCLVAEGFWPLGLQGATQMTAAFGEKTWAEHGIWTMQATERVYEQYDTQTLTIEQEVAIAQQSSRAAKAWIVQNPVKCIQLIFWKLWQEFHPRTLPLIALAPLILYGLWVLRTHPVGYFCMLLILCCALMVMATWSVKGRFLYPLLAVWTLLATAGANAIVEQLGLISESTRCNQNTLKNDGDNSVSDRDRH